MKLLGKYDYENVAVVMKLVSAKSYIADKRANLEDEKAYMLEVAKKLGVAVSESYMADKHAEEEAITEEEGSTVEVDSLLYQIISTNFKRESRMFYGLAPEFLRGFAPIPELLETLYQFHNKSEDDAHFLFTKEITTCSADS
jgi:hypothetical protein